MGRYASAEVGRGVSVDGGRGSGRWAGEGQRLQFRRVVRRRKREG